jgi:hypothetical protein
VAIELSSRFQNGGTSPCSITPAQREPTLIVGSRQHDDADLPHPIRLLRVRGERPRGRAAYQDDELRVS